MDSEILRADEGVFIKFNRTVGGERADVFVMSENLARDAVKKQVEEYLKDPSDTFVHGDLHVDEEKCHIWKPSKPLKAKVNVVLAESWESGSGYSWAFACRNEREIKEVLRHVINHKDAQHFWKLGARVYREVPVLRIAIATENHAKINRVAALKREL